VRWWVTESGATRWVLETYPYRGEFETRSRICQAVDTGEIDSRTSIRGHETLRRFVPLDEALALFKPRERGPVRFAMGTVTAVTAAGIVSIAAIQPPLATSADALFWYLFDWLTRHHLKRSVPELKNETRVFRHSQLNPAEFTVVLERLRASSVGHLIKTVGDHGPWRYSSRWAQN
jgi:hypothetical protein